MREPRLQCSSAATPQAGLRGRQRYSSPADTRNAGTSPIPNKNPLLSTSNSGSYRHDSFHIPNALRNPWVESSLATAPADV